jgi:hypothetical protein
MATTPRAHDAVQDLVRITTASARLIGRLSAGGRAADPDEEVSHIRANLDHVAALIAAERAE